MAKEKSEPTLILIRFIKEARMDEDWTFECPPGMGQNYLHRMRMQLYRFKNKIREAGKKPREFKIIYIKTEGGPEKDRVTIKMSLSLDRQVDIALREIFGNLTEEAAL